VLHGVNYSIELQVYADGVSSPFLRSLRSETDSVVPACVCLLDHWDREALANIQIGRPLWRPPATRPTTRFGRVRSYPHPWYVQFLIVTGNVTDKPGDDPYQTEMNHFIDTVRPLP
jgi:hypothetical protein